MLENVIAYSTYALLFAAAVLFVVLLGSLLSKLFMRRTDLKGVGPLDSGYEGRKNEERGKADPNRGRGKVGGLGVSVLQQDSKPGQSPERVPSHGKVRKTKIKKIHQSGPDRGKTKGSGKGKKVS